MAFPLEGIKVLDFSRVLAGPYATRMLSDLGADVVKIEPPEGDVTRMFGRRIGGLSGYFTQQNVGKRDICIDLEVAGATELVHELVAAADIVVENFRPGIMDGFGLGWEKLSAINPALVMLSISGFGQEGPERGRAAYAPILHAETGLLARHAQITGNPTQDYTLSIADTYSSLHGLVGVLAAVIMARETGRGQHIDLAMLNVLHGTDDYANFALDGARPQAGGGEIWEGPGGVEVMIAGDFKWLWHNLSRKAGVVDPAGPQDDLADKIAKRRAAAADYLRSFATFDELLGALDEMNLAWGRVRQFGEDAYSAPSVGPRGVLVEVDDRAGGRRRTIQSPYKFSDAESGVGSGEVAPHRGEHNYEALADWLGKSASDVDALTGAGILLADDAAREIGD
jgi:crotonobetainyl-CoA:carnitine CoA-transferase CaiB-like acyl-CoA transferase